MDKDISLITKLSKLCRKQGIKHLKMGDIEISLTDHAPEKLSRRVAGVAETESELIPAQYTEEEILFWSSNHQPTEEQVN